MSDITRGSGRRNAKLAALPIGVAGRAVGGLGKRIAGKSKDEVTQELMEKTAEQLFSVLGELKGGAMKVGQALSIMEAGIPEEFGEPFRDALTKLQAEAPPLPADKVHAVLDQQLGTKWRERFREFDDTPAAAASIGQVHRAVWSDGRDVAVKVQYPGADHALRADLKTLGRMSGLIQKLSPGTDVKAMVDELIDRTDAELDYLGEAEHQRAFAKAFDGDPNFLVPKVVASAPKVVVSEWVNGIPLSRLITEGSQEERNAAAARMAEFEISSPYRVGLLHGDPHPGNFFIADDGRFGVLDFGAVGVYPDGLPPETGPIFKLARDRSYDELRDLLVATDFIRPSHAAKVTPDDLEAYLKPFVDPLYTDEFHFTRQWLQRAAGNATDLRGDVYKTSRNLNVPKNFVMVFRVLLGCVGIAAQLEAYAPYRAIMTEWVPGID
ncbi:MAG TPA: AarF/UbiB family protein [Gordonia sp. (in: high G+C Gram-positive bacteria)]|uniref:ABC1 kinase family protein n=1 Tax=unclassified Gordonia (in: high G+C Gram-positive bacteria) TaxID=2657482 RepID=UPI000FA06D6D|nr:MULTISPECIES: AarF/UbiB family protein [unclassified Gordonia (in: high G+C Gram-positive bacteria)]RTL04427.1 MAG: AarF/ABC1/UbiB kinase family protein [Acidimicrobiia bacterium]HNP56115.1 AarF/UbiB family protein [Gordonia sp. (in: high G+C Gram-positive bacteria)]HRC49789.1 AarF/UbiB family protein [Gordonia sp. (in: high G+C Gram-positive bacteria)]